jgi:NCAIR mutase (PurE)-related protein
MQPTDMRELLEQVRTGALDVEAALHHLAVPPVADLGYAHVDLQRRQRCGYPEVIFCQG